MAVLKDELHFRPTVALPKPDALLRPFEEHKLFGYWFTKVRIQDPLTCIHITGRDTVWKVDPQVLRGSTYFVRNVPQPSEPADIILPRDIHPKHLGFALAWLHGGGGNLDRMQTHKLPNFHKIFESHWVIKYIIMYTFGIEEYANELLGKALPGRQYLGIGGLPDPQDIEILKRFGMMRSPLGQLLLKQAAWNLCKKVPKHIVLKNCHFDKTEVDKIRSFMKGMKRSDVSPTDKDVICEFHIHERTKKCISRGPRAPVTLALRSRIPRFHGPITD